jgi:hypothetical protein
MTRAVRDSLMLAAVAVDLAGIVYMNALRNPFAYDDFLTVVHNRALDAGGDVVAALAPAAFRPVTALSYALDRTLWGVGPFGFHLTSVLLHMVNVALLFRLALVITRRARFAFSVAAIFAVHPLATEAVGYVSARSEVLCATFFLAALLAFERALVAPHWKPALLGALFFVLALGSREVAIMLPFVLLAWDRLLLPGTPTARRRRLFYVHLPLIASMLTGGLLRVAVFFGQEHGDVAAIARYVLIQARVVWRYVGLLVWPVGQSLVHDVPDLPLAHPLTVMALSALVILGVVLVAVRRVPRVVVFGVAWFILLLLPSSVIPLIEHMAEHRTYLAMIGALFVLVTLAEVALARLVPAGRRLAIGLVTVVVVLAALGSLTVARNRIWSDPVTLWGDAATKAPGSWRARFGYGNALAMTGDCRSAIVELETAFGLHPDPGIGTNLATCLVGERRLPEARRVYERVLETDRAYVPAHYNLALIALREGDRERAHAHFVRAIAPDWRRPRWREELVPLHEKAFADPAKTLELCREILRVASETPGVRECIERNEARLRVDASRPRR